jgi:hypothetical protein
MHMLRALFARARWILKNEGLRAFLRRAFIYIFTYLSRSFFRYSVFYLYEHTIQERNEAAFMPKIQNFTSHIVSTNQMADELARDSSNDFRLLNLSAGRCLDKGAVAFLVFVGPELAHIGWMAMTEEAKNTFDWLPYRVDFSNNQACTGGTYTIPKYRGKGLMTYGYYRRFKYLGERGIKTSRNAILVNNVASQKVHAKFEPKISAKARYLKVLWFKYWKEKPLTGNGCN